MKTSIQSIAKFTDFLQSNLAGDGKSQKTGNNFLRLTPKHYLLISLFFSLAYLFVHLIASNLLLQIYIVVIIMVLPGTAIAKKRVISFQSGILSFFFSILLSLVSVMFLFFLISQALFLIGIENSFSELIVGIYVNFLVFTSSVICARNTRISDLDEKLSIGFKGVRYFVASFFLLGLSVYTVTRLNAYNSSWESVTLAYCEFICLVLIIIFKKIHSNSGLVCWALWILSTMILLSSTLRGEAGFYGYDINGEFRVAQEVLTTQTWSSTHATDAYASMLSITILPAILVLASKLSLFSIFKFFYAVLAGLIPAVLFEFARRYVRNRSAIVSIYILVLGSISYFANFPALNRQIIGTLFFLGIWIIVFQDEWSFARRKRFIAFLFFGLSFSHYTSSYLAIGIAIISGIAYSVFVTFDLFGAATSGRIQQAFAVHRQRIFTLPFTILLICITLSWNGIITQSSDNLQGAISKLVNSQNGLAILPSKDKNLLVRYLQGTTTTNLPPDEYRKSVLLSLAASHPEFELRPESFNYDMIVSNVSPIVPVLGKGFGKTLDQAGNFAKLWYQLVVVVIASTLVWIFITRRRLPIVDYDNTGSPPRSRIMSFFSNSKSSKQLYDFAGLTFAGLVLAALLRSSRVLALFYNPDRAALQIGLIWVLPFALFLEFMSGIRIWGRTAIVITSIVACVLLHDTIGLTQFYNSSFETKISAKNSAANPQLISSEESFAAKWTAGKLNSGDKIQMDGLALVNFLKYDVKAKVFANVAPFVLDQKSFIFLNGPNKIANVAYDRFLFNSYVFPLDYVEKFYLPVFISDKTALYR
jgi:uncharacterized membrane protein